MKFVALISGGKDSCFNCVKCIHYGHELVCLANIYPENEEKVELDSYMYQTVGHNAIGSLGECFNVPLRRISTKGKSITTSLQYNLNNINKNDEVEDMYNLLQKILIEYPDIKGVSCGAIISTYQRTRLENVCQRLNLTPLCYLWERNRKLLLYDMVSNGLDAILVKVAGAGLDPYKHLGKSLSELLPILESYNNKYGLDMCGEGGEYESMVITCSCFKNNKKLLIEKSNIIIDEENAEVGYLSIEGFSVKDTEIVEENDHDDGHSDCNNSNDIQYPSALQIVLESDILAKIGKPTKAILISDNSGNSSVVSDDGDISNKTITEISSVSGWGHTSLLTATNVDVNESNTNSVDQQMSNIMDQLQSMLNKYQHSNIKDVCFIHLYLADVTYFAEANSRYCQYFGEYPPSRSCVAVPLPVGVKVALDAFFCIKSHTACNSQSTSIRRSVLHVRSLSEWAPLCIGPYAQANLLDGGIAMIAGQIPLIPAKMEILDKSIIENSVESMSTVFTVSMKEQVLRSLKRQLCLSMRHAMRVQASLRSRADPRSDEPMLIREGALSVTVLINISLLHSLQIQVDWEALQLLSQYLIANHLDNEFPNYEIDEVPLGDISIDCIPLLLVGVSGIPKNSLVEVELLGSPDVDSLQHFKQTELWNINNGNITCDVSAARYLSKSEHIHPINAVEVFSLSVKNDIISVSIKDTVLEAVNIIVEFYHRMRSIISNTRESTKEEEELLIVRVYIPSFVTSSSTIANDIQTELQKLDVIVAVVTGVPVISLPNNQVASFHLHYMWEESKAL